MKLRIVNCYVPWLCRARSVCSCDCGDLTGRASKHFMGRLSPSMECFDELHSGQRNIHRIFREPSGSRLSCLVAEIISTPRI